MDKKRLSAFSFITVLLLTVGCGSADADGMTASSAAIQGARLQEPLVPMGSTDASEDEVLLANLRLYERRSQPDDLSALASFVTDRPRSVWTPAIQTNLGYSYLHYGFFSRAIASFEQAWRRGKDATDPRAKALIDRAVAELARLYASLGKNEELTVLFEEIGSRPIVGSATEGLQTAREELSQSRKDPSHLFICGPVALQALMKAQGATAEQTSFLQWYRVGPNGTSLTEIIQLADQAKFPHRVIFREPNQPVPNPGIVHWKVGHFATIVGEANGRFRVLDPVFPHQELWITRSALDAEASGYFIVPASSKETAAWRSVTQMEASQIRGKGPTAGTSPGLAGPQDPKAGPPAPNCPLCNYSIGEATVSLGLSDTPVGYSPPIGPSAKVRIDYNQREDSQPSNFGFFNVSPKWTLNWLTYVTDDPTNPGASVSRYLAGGGAYFYREYQGATGRFAAQNNDGSVLVLASQTPITYQRQMADGSVEVYAQSNGSTNYPRNVFLSKIIDPQGNSLTLNYDGQQRLTSLIDATGRQTTFTYGVVGHPLLITKITDPFGRTATLTYDSGLRLRSITDVIGLTSSFAYDSNSLVSSLTTPYGTTNFAYTSPGSSSLPRFVQATDPLGYSERVEWLEPAPVPSSDPASTVPTGMPIAPMNSNLVFRNSFYWNKSAYIAAGCSPSGGCDYAKARNSHFAHAANNINLRSTTIESVKHPLENRIWFNYPGQASSIFAGTFVKPIATGRVLDDGTTQLSKVSYDTTGYFKVTQITDPTGRTTSFSYSNQIDLVAVSQTTAFGNQETIAQFTYNTKHRPVLATDAAGQTTAYSYNPAGQLKSITNPLGQKTTYQYSAQGDLLTVTNANDLPSASFTYDAYARVRTYTDSEGWTATYDYDAADRVTLITFPDGTTRSYSYDKLDLVSLTDRELRRWTFTYDPNRRPTSIADPKGNLVLLGYRPNNEIASLTDPNGNVTSWSYDVQGRMTEKSYADTSKLTYTYETSTSRLQSILDALGQTKRFDYAQDDAITGITYLGAINATPNVAFQYDPYFSRPTSMIDGTGVTQINYVPIGMMGALRFQQEVGPQSNGVIEYLYDELGRVVSRSVGGSGAESFEYDSIGRLVGHTSDIGSFSLGYLGQTNQITQRRLANSTLSTMWSYLPNSGDRRLAEISNVGLSAPQFSSFQYTTTIENNLSAVTETSDQPVAYPNPITQTINYNNLNQIISVSGQSLNFDANGNLLSDGARNYRWDAENRLVGIGYLAQPGKSTAFTYDGTSRRTTITSIPSTGPTTVINYRWCGSLICQARDGNNSTIRAYYSEGELVSGAPPQPLYYGIDQINSVRRVFITGSNAPRFDYDPYGNLVQSTPQIADFGYAGMFKHSDSGLNLTQYRGYDPTNGRWISRDPINEITMRPRLPALDIDRFQGSSEREEFRLSEIDSLTTQSHDLRTAGLSEELNLYQYVESSPTMNVDPDGLATRKEKLEAIIQACLELLGLYSNNIEIKGKTRSPLPPISRPSGPQAKPSGPVIKPPGPSGPPPEPPRPAPPISR